MAMRGIGIDADPRDFQGDRVRFGRRLERFAQLGFDGAELALVGMHLIRGGELDGRKLARFVEMARRYPLRYACHGPESLNLATTRNAETQRRAFEACLRICAEVGSEVLVYHSGLYAAASGRPGRAELPEDAELESQWQRETAGLREMAALAEGLGVTIAVENNLPLRDEVEALAAQGLAQGELGRYRPDICLDALARQVREIGSPHVGLALDVGHAFLATPYWGDSSYLEAIEACAPLVAHVHVHDNLGRLEDAATCPWEQQVLGEGDMHMPPGWGGIPLREVLGILGRAGYGGWLDLEICPRYEEYAGEALANLRRLAAEQGLGAAAPHSEEGLTPSR